MACAPLSSPTTCAAIFYIPRESSRRKAHVEQPRTTAEAVAALRAEEAREVASYGEPDVGRRSVSVRDGDPEKAEQLMAHVCRIEARLKTELRFAERFLLLRLVWAPFCGWRLRRVMRKDWNA